MPRVRTLDANPLDSTELTDMDADALAFAGLDLHNPNGIDPDTLLELGRDRTGPPARRRVMRGSPT